jgi:hypothetical protein
LDEGSLDEYREGLSGWRKEVPAIARHVMADVDPRAAEVEAFEDESVVDPVPEVFPGNACLMRLVVLAAFNVRVSVFDSREDVEFFLGRSTFVASDAFRFSSRELAPMDRAGLEVFCMGPAPCSQVVSVAVDPSCDRVVVDIVMNPEWFGDPTAVLVETTDRLLDWVGERVDLNCESWETIPAFPPPTEPNSKGVVSL